VSDAINTRGVLVALGADPNHYDRGIPLLDHLLAALRDGETASFTVKRRRGRGSP
jgi:hypothetical protein